MLPNRRRQNRRQFSNVPVEQLESRLLLTADVEWTFHKDATGATPSGAEQELLWLINDARSDPAAAGEFLATSNNPAIAGDRDGFNVNTTVLQNEFDTYSAKQPLAYDIRLSDAAEVHAQDLIDRDAEDSTGQFQRVADAGFQTTDVNGNVYSNAENALNAHARFAIDWEDGGTNGVADGRPARALTMSLDTEWTNVGLSILAEDDPGTSNGPNVVVENFAIASQAQDHFNQFIVGTIWEDLNANNRYDDGEGIDNVRVSPNIGDYFARTGEAGGYSIPITEPGDYELTIVGPDFSTVRNVTIDGDSVLVNVEKGSLTPRAELEVGTFVANPDNAVAGGNASFDWQVANTGTAAAGQFEVEFFFSADDQFDPFDMSIGVNTVFSVAAGETTAVQSRSFTLPASGDNFWDGDGDYYVLMQIDRTDQVNEPNEANNTAAISNTLNVTGTGSSSLTIDLTGGVVDIQSATATAGGAIDLQWNVANVGTVPAAAFGVDFYISVDNQFDPNDVQIGTANSGGIAGGASSSLTNSTFNLPVPNDPFWSSDGPHFIVMDIDPGGDITESNELNNVIPSATSVNVTGTGLASSDLSGVSVTLSPVNVSAGGTVTATYDIQNTGAASTGDFTVAFYLSQDTLNDPTDQVLTTRVQTGIPGSSSTGDQMISLSLPAAGSNAWSGDGEYHILMEVDMLDVVQETNENNNFLGSTNRINVTNTDGSNSTFELDIDGDGSQQALTDGVLTLRYMAGFGGNALVDGATGAGGSRTTAAAVTQFLDSAGTSLDIDGDGAIQPLTDGILILRFLAGFSGNTLINNAFNPDGSRTTVTAITDHLNSLNGGSGGGGAGSGAMIDPNSRPDLIAGIPVATPLSARAGESVVVDWSATNQGEAASTSFDVGFYLSADDQSDPADRLVSTQTIQSLVGSGGTTGTLQNTILLPGIDDSFWEGADDVFVIVLVDDGNLVDEEDETNNVSVSADPIQVETFPDLIPATFSTDVSAAAAGSDVNVDWEVQNTGNADAGIFRVNFFLSTDNQFSPGDRFLVAENIDGLAGDASTGVQNLAITLPAAGDSFYPAGGEGAEYFLLMIVDPQSDVDESSETNNTATSDAIVINGTTEALPDLTGGSLAVNTTDATPGNFITVTRQIANRGLLASGTFGVNYFISRDNEIGPGDEIIGSENMPSIDEGAMSSMDQLQLTLPAQGNFWTGDGDYHIIMVVDANGDVTELNEDNNVVPGDSTIAVTETTLGNLDIDDDANVQPLTDGILSLRFLAGFGGSALVNNAVNPQGQRITAPQITAFLEDMGTGLDVDADGSSQALTDGILILRYMAGFQGDTLINNAVGPDATRSSAAEIEAYLDTLMPPAGGAGSGGGAVGFGAGPSDDIDDLFGNGGLEL